MEDKLPRRIAWFAPWTWKRRTLCAVLAVLLPIAYVLTWPVVDWTIRKTDVLDSKNRSLRRVGETVHNFYYPARQVGRTVAGSYLYAYEWNAMSMLFGPPKT